MLQNKIKLRFDVEGNSVWLQDSTGVYDTNNPNGFGAPNLDLNQVALLSVLQFIDEGVVSNASIISYPQIYFNASAANDDSIEFEYKYLKDGHYLGDIIVIEASADGATFLSGTPIVEEDYYYNTTTEGIYQVVSGAPVEVTDYNTLVDNSALTQAVCEEMYLIDSMNFVNDIYHQAILSRRAQKYDKEMELLGQSSLINDRLQGVLSIFNSGTTVYASEVINEILEELKIE